MHNLAEIKLELKKVDTTTKKLMYLENLEREIKELCWNIEKNMNPQPNDVGEFLPDPYSDICDFVMYETKDTEFMQFIPTTTKEERTKYLNDYKDEIKELEKYEGILTFIHYEKEFQTKQWEKYGNSVINNSEKERTNHHSSKISLTSEKIQWNGTENQFVLFIELLLKTGLINKYQHSDDKWSVFSNHFLNRKGNSFDNKQLAKVFSDRVAPILDQVPENLKDIENIIKCINNISE